VRILVVDDDPSVQTALRILLARDGYTVATAGNGVQALEIFADESFDLVVLDWMMPEMDGLEACRRMREKSAVPILMLTARSSESDKVRVLDAGADDYVTKPFGPREFLARVRALVRRSETAGRKVERRMVVGDLAIDPETGQVTVGERQVAVTPTEMRLLASLAVQPGQVRSPRELARDLGVIECSDRDAQEIAKVNVMRLRRKIEEDPANPRRLVTHRGYGYSLQAAQPGVVTQP
jgi:two-component system response regulator MtrA